MKRVDDDCEKRRNDDCEELGLRCASKCKRETKKTVLTQEQNSEWTR